MDAEPSNETTRSVLYEDTQQMVHSVFVIKTIPGTLVLVNFSRETKEQ